MLATKHQDFSLLEKKKQDFQTTLQPQQPTRLNKYVKRRLMVFSIVSGIILINGGANLYAQSKELEEKQREYVVLRKELKQLKTKGETLENEITKLETPEYAEKIARRDFFLSKKGEIIFHIVDEQ